MTLSPGWTDELSLRVARDESFATLVDYLTAAIDAGVAWADELDVLTTRFALSYADARLAHDRVLGGRVRAATTSLANRPDPRKDPVAWASYLLARGETVDYGETDEEVRVPRSAAWHALVAAASSGDGGEARARVDGAEFARGASQLEREAAERWRDAFDARGRSRGTDDVGLALRVAQLADATVASSAAVDRKQRVMLQAATGIATAAESCIAALGGEPCAREGSALWGDGVELATASRRIAAHAAALGDIGFEGRALDLRGRIVTRLLGQCRARVGAAMLESIRWARRAGDDARAATMCNSVVLDFADLVDEWEADGERPLAEDQIALAFLREALEARAELGVATDREPALLARCAALLLR